MVNGEDSGVNSKNLGRVAIACMAARMLLLEYRRKAERTAVMEHYRDGARAAIQRVREDNAALEDLRIASDHIARELREGRCIPLVRGEPKASSTESVNL